MQHQAEIVTVKCCCFIVINIMLAGSRDTVITVSSTDVQHVLVVSSQTASVCQPYESFVAKPTLVLFSGAATEVRG